MARTSALFFLVVALPGVVLAQNCVSSVTTGINARTLTLHGTGAALGSAVQAAASVWGNCSSMGLPPISLGSGGTLDYAVMISGTSSGPVCGVTDPNAHVIYISQNYTYQGRQYPCNLDTTLEHEIGHIFGLADSSCGGNYLMGQVSLGQTDQRSLQPGECSQADQNVVTPAEQTSGGPNDPCSQQAFARVGDDNDDDPSASLPCGSPLILDMNGDGVHTTSLSSPVAFDLLGNGRLVETSWTDPATEEAFLVFDLDGNGRVDSGRELFGTDTLLPSGRLAGNGFEALAVYDDPAYGGNGDGEITPGDRIWYFLDLWIDRNHNGISEPRELKPLRSSGIRSLDLGFVERRIVDRNGNWHRFAGTYSRKCRLAAASCERAGLLEDVYFLFN